MAPNVEGKNHRLHRETINCKDSEFKWCVTYQASVRLHQVDAVRCRSGLHLSGFCRRRLLRSLQEEAEEEDGDDDADRVRNHGVVDGGTIRGLLVH